MWNASEEQPGTMEGRPPDAIAHTKETCEQSKTQLETLKEIMLKNKQSLKKKEEEVQEYAKRLSKIKSRAKLSSRNKDTASTSGDTAAVRKIKESTANTVEDTVDDSSSARTPNTKSSLLQKKLAENRKAFERRNKEIIETKRVVEEKVEAIRQQLEEKSHSIADINVDQSSVIPITPIVIASDAVDSRQKDNEITMLNNKILELEATVLDLRENLKEKDSVIESKTKAVTLLSADLSMKGKTTLDTLEDTKDEMRTMQEHFVLLETSLKNKNDHLMQQLQDRDNKILELEEALNRSNQQLVQQKEIELANTDFSRSTMDTLMETKDAMKGMQENFVLIETSLKSKIEHLLGQLQDREAQLEEANNKIRQFERAAEGETNTTDLNMQFESQELAKSNQLLQNENKILNERIVEMEERLIGKENDALKEKDNKIAELESLVEELKQNVESSGTEFKGELQNQIAQLTSKNEEYAEKLRDMEKSLQDLEMGKDNIESKLQGEEVISKENEKVQQLVKELDELNKSMIKMKAQHRSKVKNLQKQLEGFKKVSDVNAELVRLANQVTLLEEEKGNLQLSLIDFDELKASTEDLQGRITDLENKVAAQATEIKMHVDAIAALEDQKLELMQELHAVKQEVSALEAENAESENLRVTAEMKVVELEENLDSLQKAQNVQKADSLMKIDQAGQEDNETATKSVKIEEKTASDSGSTESFENLQVERNDLLQTFEDIPKKNQESMLKLSKSDEKGGSTADSSESFETINDVERTELQKTQESGEIAMKLDKIEEKGSSDTGSTESFERIPGHNEGITKIELLTQENYDLIVKVTKLEEKLETIKMNRDKIVTEATETSMDVEGQLSRLVRENEDLSNEVTKLRAQICEYMMVERPDSDQADDERSDDSVQRQKRSATSDEQSVRYSQSNIDASDELGQLREILADKLGATTKLEIDADFVKSRIDGILEESKRMAERVETLEESNKVLREDIERLIQEKDELKVKLDDIISEENNKKIGSSKQSEETDGEKLIADEQGKSEEDKLIVVDELDAKIKQCMQTIEEQNSLIEELKSKLTEREEELQMKIKEISKYDSSSDSQMETLRRELKDSTSAVEEWKYKFDMMQEKMDALAAEKEMIEQSFGMLEKENVRLEEVIRDKEVAVSQLKENMESATQSLETKLSEQITCISAKEKELMEMEEKIEEKDRDLEATLVQLQNMTLARDSLLDKLSDYNGLIDSLRHAEETLRITQNKLDQSEAENRELSTKIINMKERISDLEYEVFKKEKEIAALATVKTHMEAQLMKIETAKKETERHICELEDSLANSSKYAQSLRQELDDAYRTIEVMKEQRAEDFETHNRIVYELVEENQTGQKELEYLDNVLEEKEQKLREQNFTEETKITLETTIADLTTKLNESDRKAQAQLEKMKKIAATLKKKTTICQELESRVAELEEKWMSEKDEKQQKNKMIQEAENAIRERDDKIVHLESKLASLQEENSGALANIEKLVAVEASLREETVVLKNRLTETEEEISTLRADINKTAAKLSQENLEKEKILNQMEILTNQEMASKQDAMSLRNRLEEMDQEISKLRMEANQMSNDVEDQKLARENLLADVERLTTIEIELKNEVNLSRRRFEEAEEEIIRLRSMLDDQSAEIVAEKHSREQILAEYESYKEQMRQDNEQQQVVLDEVKENARELNVRMQVMENEYVDQLALIKNLKAENGLLQSKHTQINEKLENVEKTSEERRLMIEQLQRDIEKATSQTSTIDFSTQTVSLEEIENSRDETGTSTTQRPLSGLHCEHCDQCQTLVQALEAKLQEREAEIENLDNELANSIGNFVQMRESLRYSDLMNNQTLRQNRTLEDLLLQYNAMSSDHEEIKTKLQIALRENEELKTKIESLEATNATSGERPTTEEESLRAEKEICQRRIAELEAEMERWKSENQQATSSSVEPSLPKLFDASQIFGTVATKDDTSGFLSGIDTTQASQVEEQSRVRREVIEPVMTQESARTAETEVDLGDDSWGGDWGETVTEEQTVKSPSTGEEFQLRARINELQSQIDIVEAEKLQVIEDGKAMQIRCAKLAKKLKEYKAHIDNLQQQLSQGTKKASTDFGGLDSAIEEALQSRIEEVEKALKDATEECKRATMEKESLLQRLEVIAAANDRYMESKERQDMDIQTLRIENKEFVSKVENLERRLRELSGETAEPFVPLSPVKEANPPTMEMHDSNNDATVEQLKLENNDLKAEMEALASENEQLQRLLEEQKTQLVTIKAQTMNNETVQQLEEISSKNIELQNTVKQSSAKYEEMEKEFQAQLVAVNERLRGATEEVNELNQRLIESESKGLDLQTEMNKVLAEKADLEGRINGLTAMEEKLSSTEQALSNVTDLLNARVQEVADLKQELQQQYIVRQNIEKQIEETANKVAAEFHANELNWQNRIENERQVSEQRLQERLVELQNYQEEIEKLRERLNETENLVETLKAALSEKDSRTISREEFEAKVDEASRYETELEKLRNELSQAWKDLAKKEEELMAKKEATKDGGSDADLAKAFTSDQSAEPTKVIDNLPVFTMFSDDGSGDNRDVIEKYKREMEEKQQEIEHLRYVLSENTYPRILQEMQDTVNCLHDEKAQLESSLREATQVIAEKHLEAENLKRQIERYENPKNRLDGQEKIVELQNELHVKEQEINELRYVIAEKDSQLNFRASNEPSSDEFQLRGTIETLTNELYNKDREIQRLESTEKELRAQLANLQELETLLYVAKEAQTTLEGSLKEKEMELEEVKKRMFADNQRLVEEIRSKEAEIGNLKAQLEMLIAENRKYLEEVRNQNSQLEQMNAQIQYLVGENQTVLESLRSKESQVERLKLQIDSLTADLNEKLHQKEDDLSHALVDLAEKERRLAELSITKDAELHDLKVKIHEKEVRIEELMALSEEEESQLEELRKTLDLKEEEIEILRDRLEDKIKEYELSRSLSSSKEASTEGTSTSESNKPSTSTELDLALYMLHQRDVRCEELTHELMQLLEERDTLQLRLSNAIKLNEELRKSSPPDLSPTKSSSPSSSANEPSIDDSSRSNPDGPVEIAKEAIHDIPVGEDKEALAEKLSQLRTMGHAKDVRLRDERELRHTQQMSLYSHRDVLNSLPPEAAARLVNANYTLSRDVQSQSSVLFNWLWGKSTPKVVHM